VPPRDPVRKRVLVTDFTWPDTRVEAAILDAAGADLVVAGTGDEAELLELVGDADAILTCFNHVTPAVVRAGTRLQVIGRYGIGTDNIAVDVATELGIPVTNVPEYCTDEVAEHALALLFALVRGLHRYDRAVRAGDWTLAPGLPTRRIAGSTLGIVGFGRIGRALAERARALRMHVLVHTRRPEAARDAGFEPAELDELATRSDFVSLHVPLVEETRGLVDAAFLARMKPTAHLINVARGALVDHDALARALASGEIAGAGVDVFAPERLPADHPLLACANLLATPHTAFYSSQSIADLAALAARNVADILSGRRPASVVNPEVLALGRWAHLESALPEPPLNRGDRT
jgi:D-3-phosphoglycerate dehydrogenase / 2-oxoglutarate reductase